MNYQSTQGEADIHRISDLQEMNSRLDYVIDDILDQISIIESTIRRYDNPPEPTQSSTGVAEALASSGHKDNINNNISRLETYVIERIRKINHTLASIM